MDEQIRKQKEFAAQSLHKFKEVMDRLGIPFWLTLGTALGAYRDGDFCAGDHDDIDTGVDYKYRHRADEIIRELAKAGFENRYNFFPDDDISPEYCFFMDNDLGFRNKIDMWFYTRNPKDKSQMLWRFFKGGATRIGAERVGANTYATRANPARHFKRFDKVNFYGREYNIPRDIEKYFETNYGPNWRTPIPRDEWNYMTDNESPDPEHEFTFVAKTFKRPECVRKLVESIRKFYNEPILICNDDGTELKVAGAEVINVPEFDIGVAAGKNLLVEKVKTKYVVPLDDDFVFTEDTKIELMLKKLKEGNYDMVSGALRGKGGIGLQHYEGRFEVKDGVLRQIKATEEPYDYVFNFFIADARKMKNHKWDPDLKIAEHNAFFLTHKGKFKIGYEPRAIVEHVQKSTPEYKKFRSRAASFYLPLSLRKAGLRRFITQNGTEYEAMPEIKTPEPDTAKHYGPIGDVTAVIISFLRPQYTKECIRSLKKQYPGIRILVAENGKFDEDLQSFVRSHGGRYVQMPFDSGVCYARNRLVEMAESKYVLIGDDDFYYEDDAGVGKMVEFLNAHPEFTLIGGRIREGGGVKDYQGNIEISKDTITYRKLDEKRYETDKASGLRYQPCDITFNYFLARRDGILKAKWDEQIKVKWEHSDWFITAKKNHGIRVAFAPDAIVTHKPAHVAMSQSESDEYGKFRNRMSDEERFMTKHGISKIIGFNGLMSEFNHKMVHKNKANAGKYYAERPIVFDGKTYNVGEIIITDKPVDGMRPC